ncbi:hypothetical protein G7046_g3003 [Stylonectria norvegica]|nr:hypothetical protein G7046_g3003 [Stylonectria norvegica]
MLHVIIVGAGIAGLSAAISLRRAGHAVDVYERSSMNNEIGAAINVPPNATRFLTAWGLDPVRWRFVKSRVMTYNDPKTMEITATVSTPESPKAIGGADLYYAHRVDLHNALKWMATRPDGLGKPVKIHLKSDVVGYNPLKPSLTLSTGEEICGDVVIGADGVHSIASVTVMGEKRPVPPVHFNCCFRFLIPAETLEEDPATRFWNEDREGWTRLFPHNETQRRIVAYPCRDNTMHNFVVIYYDDDLKDGVKEDWQHSVDVSEVLEKFSDFNPRLLKVVSKATEVRKWPLLYRPPVSTWHKGRMALAGDAAHPMLPHQAQAGAQGLEDGLVLGIVLQGANTPEDIEERLKLYVDIRRKRASAIQVLSNVGQDQASLVREDLLQYMTEDEYPTSPAHNQKYTYGYDVVRAAVDAMKKRDASFELPAGFFEYEVLGAPAA